MNNPRLGVRPTGEPIPTFLLNTPAESIFGAMVRMQDGEAHPQLKAAIRQALEDIDEILIQQTALTVAREIA
ncbi:cytochrome P450, partial [Paraburkholderia sp. SIMBA_061]